MPFSLFTIRNFLRGVILLGLPDSIPEGTFRKAINIRVDRTLGSITNRPGWTKLSSAVVASGAIVWISKLFGSTIDYSYAHIGNEIYRDTDAWAGTGTDITTTSAGTAKVSDVNFIDGEGGIWKYMVNGNIAIKDNGTTTQTLGIPAPTAAALSVALAADLTTTIDTMDATAGWTLAGGIGLAADTTIKQEGTGSLHQAIAPSTLSTLDRTLTGTPLDIDTLTSGDDTVKDDDYIHIWVHIDRPERVEFMQIDFDFTTGGGGTFTENYYSVHLPALSRLARGSNQWTQVQARKSSFTRFGDDATWSAVRDVRITFLTNSLGAVVIHTDDLKLRGGVGMEGSVEYAVTNHNSTTGGRSNPFKNSDGVAQYTIPLITDRQRITVTVTNIDNPADTQIDQLSFWRRSSIFPTAQFLADQSDATTTFTDNNSDVTLLANTMLLNLGNDAPPTGTTRVIFGPNTTGHLFMIVNGHRLHFSQPFEDSESRGENWPSSQFALIGDGSHFALAGIATDTEVFVWNETQTFQVVGAGSNLFLVIPIDDSHEIVGQYAVTSGGGAVYFVANDGVYEQRGGIQTKLTRAIDPFFNGITVDGHLPLVSAASSRADIRLVYVPAPEGDFLELLYPDNTATVVSQSLVLKRNFTTQRLTECFFDTAALTDVRSVYVDTEDNEIIAGGADGNVYRIEDETTEDDAGTGMAITMRTRSEFFDTPLAKKKVSQLFLEGDTNSQSLTVTALYSRNTVSEILSAFSTSDINTISYHATADPELRRDDVAIEVTGTVNSRITIARLAMDVQVLPEAREFFDTGVITFAAIQLMKYVEFDIRAPTVNVTVQLYIGGQLKDTKDIPFNTEQHIVRHYFSSGIKGYDLRITLTSTSAFELANMLLFSKALGSSQGWRPTQLGRVI